MADKEGYLLKEGAGLVKSYKKRYFTLKGQELSYYGKQGEKEPTGSISMAHTKVIDNGDKTFTITGPQLSRAYNLAVENLSEKAPWLAALNAAASAAGGSSGAAGGAEEQTLLGAKVGLKDFDVLQVIGRGSFGKVMKVSHKATGKIYAMKALRKDVLLQENMVQNAKDEKQILQDVTHPFVVKLHFAFQTKDRLYLVLDLLPGGELFFHLKNDGVFPESRIRLYVAEIVSALAHLHDLGIIYRDLKPENIVLDAGGHAMLTDMGLAKTKMGANVQTYTFCGTPEYIAPEILKGTGHNKGVDWWALGVLTFEMFTGLPPFYSENVNEMYELILNKELEFPAEISPDARDLISRLLVRDPAHRLTDGHEIQRHRFFSSIDWEKLNRKEYTPQFVPDLSGDTSKYVEDEFKDQSTKNSIYQSTKASEADITGF